MGALTRLFVYSGVGFAAEVAISAIHDLWRQKPLRFRTSAWMLPVYALLAPLYEPVHDAVRARAWPVRSAAYGVGFLAVEYASGVAFRKTRGAAPWDYSDARYHLHGLIRPDYFFQWAALGLALEPLHDRLVRTHV